MSILDTAENPEKENTQGVEIHLAKINNNGWKADRSSLDRRQTGGASTSLTNVEKGRAGKRTIINVDCQIDASTAEEQIYECMTQEKPCIGF